MQFRFGIERRGLSNPARRLTSLYHFVVSYDVDRRLRAISAILSTSPELLAVFNLDDIFLSNAASCWHIHDHTNDSGRGSSYAEYS